MRKRFVTLSLPLFVLALFAILILPGYAQKSTAKKSDSTHQSSSASKNKPKAVAKEEAREQKNENRKAVAASRSRKNPPKSGKAVPVFSRNIRFDVSTPVRSMKAPKKKKEPGLHGAPFLPRETEEVEAPIRTLLNKSLERDKNGRTRAARSIDSVVQDALRITPNMPTPSLTFEGIGNVNNEINFGDGFLIGPPDPNGDVGPNNYVQTVNLAFQVFDKSGIPEIPPLPISVLFSGFGDCGNFDDGDPIVLYDPLADRWLISQFQLETGPPFHECVAISQNGDPLGSYFRYDFEMPKGLVNDYPHFGVWPDAYYMMDNQFDPDTGIFAGTGAFAFDRAKMLAGDPDAGFIYFDVNDIDRFFAGVLPSDLDGNTPPPPGTPNHFAAFDADEFGGIDSILMYDFHADFEHPENSTFTARPESPIPIAAFDPDLCDFEECVPQPDGPPLDPIADRLMHRLAYRNFGGHESLVLNFTVDANGNDQAGVRWTELQSTSGGPFTVAQQSTFAPHSDGRWMGSTALDNQGNQAVGYSVSSANTFPSIRYAGRLTTDPSNQLVQGEATLVTGSGSQTVFFGGRARWGDYSGLTVDPVDDCTFWYTTEYYVAPDEQTCSFPGACWQTRVGSFKFPSCTPPAQGTIAGNVTGFENGNPIEGARVIAIDGAGNSFETATDADGNYSRLLPPGDYNVHAAGTGCDDSTPVPVTITDGETSKQDFTLSCSPTLIFDSSSIDDSGGNNNGFIDPNECVNLNISIANVGLGNATGINSTLTSETPGVAVTSAGSTYNDIQGGDTNTATNNTPFQLSISPVFPCPNEINLTLHVTTSDGPFDIPVHLKTGAVSSFSSNTPVDIPDSDPDGVDSPITVSGVTSAISNVKVTMHITHTWDGDIHASLIAPNGTEVLLTENNGGNGNNYGTDCPADDNDTTFDDDASITITDGTPPFVGTFTPEEPLSAYSGLSGDDVNGTWRLHVFDDTGSDVGTIQCWKVEFVTCGDGVGVCPNSPPNLIFDSANVDDNTEGGNDDGKIDPNECFNLNVNLANLGPGGATGISAVLSSDTPGVTITQTESGYENIGVEETGGNVTSFQLQTSTDFVCATDVQFSLLVTTDQGTFTVPLTLSSGSTDTFQSSGDPIPIPDADPAGVDSTINIQGVTQPISKVQVAIYLTHTHDQDLQISLVGPDSTTIDLSSNNGGEGKNYGTDCPADDNDTIFDDTASTSITAGTAPFVGTFTPEQALSLFNGKDANGDWKLHVVDDDLGDDGAIQCWSMTMTTCGNGNCSPCPIIDVTPDTLPDGGLGVAYSQIVTQTGGAAPVAFSVSSGALPDGLALDSATGAITGTPTAAGTFNFTITATDSGNCTGSQAYTVNVGTPFVLLSTFDGSSGWVKAQGNVTESNGSLVLVGNKSSANAPNPWPPSNTFGCSLCLIEYDDVVVGVGGIGALDLWNVDNSNKVLVILKPNGKITLKQFANGHVVASQDFKKMYTPGVPVGIGISYDGTQFNLSIGGAAQAPVPTSSAPGTGNVGIDSRKQRVSVGEVRVSLLP